jgi:hypothetical protein
MLERLLCREEWRWWWCEREAEKLRSEEVFVRVQEFGHIYYCGNIISLDTLNNVAVEKCMLQGIVLLDHIQWDYVQHSFRAPDLLGETAMVGDPNSHKHEEEEDEQA